ncbi:MAG TPA: hypothetical protein VMA31_16635, partial [Bryobacteraceae bacterium]|nr:hypothetical protein [Bryobacteraceae bacterium]
PTAPAHGNPPSAAPAQTPTRIAKTEPVEAKSTVETEPATESTASETAAAESTASEPATAESTASETATAVSAAAALSHGGHGQQTAKRQR